MHLPVLQNMGADCDPVDTGQYKPDASQKVSATGHTPSSRNDGVESWLLFLQSCFLKCT